ncbi:MAG: dTDP-4-dehydrorhamnose reductase [Mariprofundaceae bacterium]|nr:dTDP-4-dehydrorhamnose reductase [Mariprofundaceae bacterium]
MPPCYRAIDMKVLITGCHGQVGRELMLLAASYDCEAVGVDRDELNITDQNAVVQAIYKYSPDAIINAAAYTAVDKAEDDVAAAQAVNATAVSYLAEACANADIPFVHISTDYIFDGRKHGDYDEYDVVSPLGVYGETKLAGEEAVQKFCKKYYILRTSWVFSAHGNNFVKTMLRLGAERDVLGVVADQYGKPTSANEIARVIYEMLTSHKQAWGLYHIAQSEVATWFGFAEAIFAEARSQGVALKLSTLNAIQTEDYPTPAKRPANSELNCDKLEQTFKLNIKPWKDSLADVIKDLNHV